MIKYYRTDDRILKEIDEATDGCWINLTNPTSDETDMLAAKYHLDVADLRAPLDEEESSRVDIEKDYTLILVDIPAVEMRSGKEAYTTIPLGIIIVGNVIITVCKFDTPILQFFFNGTANNLSTKKQLRFTYQILFRTCMFYQYYLRIMDKRRTEFEARINSKTEDSDLIELHELESNLVYFATSLRANDSVLDRLSRYSKFRQYPEDNDLLDDVIVENRQAIEMTGIYRDILNGTRELLSSVINNRMNNVMKYLTAITIVMAIPNIISGLYGMNLNKVGMPFAEVAYGFEIIIGIIFIICAIVFILLKKFKFFK